MQRDGTGTRLDFRVASFLMGANNSRESTTATAQIPCDTRTGGAWIGQQLRSVR